MPRHRYLPPYDRQRKQKQNGKQNRAKPNCQHFYNSRPVHITIGCRVRLKRIRQRDEIELKF